MYLVISILHKKQIFCQFISMCYHVTLFKYSFYFNKILICDLISKILDIFLKKAIVQDLIRVFDLLINNFFIIF